MQISEWSFYITTWIRTYSGKCGIKCHEFLKLLQGSFQLIQILAGRIIRGNSLEPIVFRNKDVAWYAPEVLLNISGSTTRKIRYIPLTPMIGCKKRSSRKSKLSRRCTIWAAALTDLPVHTGDTLRLMDARCAKLWTRINWNRLALYLSYATTGETFSRNLSIRWFRYRKSIYRVSFSEAGVEKYELCSRHV